MTICIHFGICGGCLTQDLDTAAYAASKRQQVVVALARTGMAAMVEETISVAPGTRRRAVFKVHKHDGVTDVGFHAARSHSIVDMRECLLLTPNLVAAVPGLRMLFGEILADGQHADLHATDTESGLDIAVKANTKLAPDIIAALARYAANLNLARVTWNKNPALELAAPVIRFAGVPVRIPPETFLQASYEGEALLQARVLRLLNGARHVADLFAGCGTFTLPLAKKAKLHAVEQDTGALAALMAATRGASGLKPVTTERRDLFKRPLTPPELKQYDAVLLDPPRAGAVAQVAQLAKSKIGRIAYVSCNAETFAADAATLTKAGFRIGAVTPIDQFLWSAHIELVAGFERP